MKRNSKQTFTFYSLITLLMISQTINSYYVFRTSVDEGIAAIFPHYKPKNLDEDVYEDRVFANSLALVLSDGVGGWPFPSSFMADLLVQYTAASIIASKLDQTNQSIEVENPGRYDDLSDIIPNDMIDGMERYRNTVEQVVSAFLEENKNYADEGERADIARENLNFLNVMPEWNLQWHFGGAGTLLGAYIKDAHTDKARLRIFQGGDSLAMVLFPQPTNPESQESSFYYEIKFVTDDMQKQFNTPTQIASTEYANIVNNVMNDCSGYTDEKFEEKKADLIWDYFLKNVAEFDLDIDEEEILVLGSDGLFDNIPSNMLVIMINYVMKQLQEHYRDGIMVIEDPNSLLDELVDEYHKMAVDSQDNFFDDYIDYLNEFGGYKVEEESINTNNYCDIFMGVFYYDNSAIGLIFLNDEVNNSFNNSSVQEAIYDPENEFGDIQIQHSPTNKIIIDQPNVLEEELNFERRNSDHSLGAGSINSADLLIEMESVKNIPLQIHSTNPDKEDTNSKHKFNSRLLMTDILAESGCSMVKLAQHPIESGVRFINTLNQEPCVDKILSRLAVDRDYLEIYGYKVMSTALGAAAYKISQYEDMLISGFAVRGHQFNKDIRGVKPDDITVIVSKIENKDVETVNEELQYQFDFDKIFEELAQGIDEYLVNTLYEKDFYNPDK